MAENPFGLWSKLPIIKDAKHKHFDAATKIVLLCVALVVIWKLTVELPKAWSNAKNTAEKLGSLSIVL